MYDLGVVICVEPVTTGCSTDDRVAVSTIAGASTGAVTWVEGAGDCADARPTTARIPTTHSNIFFIHCGG